MNLRSLTTAAGLHVPIRNECDATIAHEVFWDEAYGEPVNALLDAIGPGAPADCDERIQIVDLGLNLGYFSLYVLDRLLFHCEPDRFLYRKIHITGVEAVHELAFQAGENLANQHPTVELNSEIRIYPGLAGLPSGTGTLHLSSSHPCSRLCPDNTAQDLTGEKRDIGYVPLSQILPGPVDLMKCDIEGAEEQLIAHHAALLNRTRILAAEFHPPYCDLDRCLAMLAELGFIEQPGALTGKKHAGLRWFRNMAAPAPRAEDERTETVTA